MAVEQQLRQISVLIIGGGAVAQVLGKHLAQAGVNIALYLKPKYAGASNSGFAMYPTTHRGKRINARWDDFKIYTNPAQLRALHADQVYVCVGQHDLRSGWLEEIWPNFRHALWIFMQPGLGDFAYASKTVPERFIVQGKMGFLAYLAPIGDEQIITPGVAYWTPPGGHTYFKGRDDETGLAVCNLLNRGGLPCSLSSDFQASRLYGSALLLPFILSLEARGWSMERLRKDDPAVARMCVAVHELASAVEIVTGKSSVAASRLRKPWVWRMLLKYGPRYAPIPIEAYYRTKYSRLRAQTELLLDEYAGLLARHGIQPLALADLRRDWLAMRPRMVEGPAESMPDAFAAAAARTHTNSIGVEAPVAPASQSNQFAAASQSNQFAAASQSGQFQQPMNVGQFAQQPQVPAQHTLRPNAPDEKKAEEPPPGQHRFRPDGQ